MKNILIVDDDIYIGNMLEESLIKEGYSVSRAYSGTEALYVLSQMRPDLILLDLMLPGLEGEGVLPHVKGIPVIIVSAKIDIDSKVNLLLGGAVDYVTKPFHMKELLARISVHLRNAAGMSIPSILTWSDLTLHTDTHIVRIDGAAIKLTRTEYAILKLLMPVSYTHLDVYKRQGMSCNGLPRSGKGPAAVRTAVSYTHLDVYKRQAFSCLISK